MKKYTIVADDGKTQATIVSDRGAFVSSLILPFQSGVHETLFLHDYAFDKTIKDLPGGIPFLFPICGRVTRNENRDVYLYDGKIYQLNIHGFSWREKWAVENQTKNSIELVLRDNPDTLKCYPFHFEVKLIFMIENGKLTCHQTYKNNESEKAMPYYAGFHPYFLTPSLGAGKEKVMLRFEAVRRFKYNDKLNDIAAELPIFNAPMSVADSEINEQLFLLSENKIATLLFPNGDSIKTDVRGDNDSIFPYLQLYTAPEEPFFCLERWMSFANALNTVSGVRWLNPGKSESAVFEISADCTKNNF
jgi:galactose mutarotase-like enzyme